MQDRSEEIPSGGHSTLLVDFGGVLTTSVWESFAAFCTSEGLPETRILELFRDDLDALKLLRGLESGTVEEAEFEREFARLVGVADSEGLIGRVFAGLEPDERMVEAVRAVRAAGRRTGLISNTWGMGIYDRGLLPELFDEVVLSAEVGLHKPQPEIFLLAAERLGVEPGECVFVDDLRENCSGAEAVGMSAILHRDTDRTLEQIAAAMDLQIPV